jgi:hypothetical protein
LKFFQRSFISQFRHPTPPTLFWCKIYPQLFTLYKQVTRFYGVTGNSFLSVHCTHCLVRGLGGLTPLSTIFNYMVAVSFISGGNRNTQGKPPTCRKSLKLDHKMLYRVHLAIGFYFLSETLI